MADSNATKPAVEGNEINFWGRLTAGILLITLTGAVIVTLIGFWPNKMPAFNAGDDQAWYTCDFFHMTLIEDSAHEEKSIPAGQNSNIPLDSLKTDTPAISRPVSTLNPGGSPVVKTTDKCGACCSENKIHLNTILLLLVALMGFLGNMIHVASSFTAYVGNNTFKRSWILWYFVKPFTAAGLAVIVYFIIRAGFLSYGTGAAGISLYGILSLAALAGLFTDSATLKLKEVFEVIFKTKDDRKDKLNGSNGVPAATVSDVSPLSIPSATATTITITGSQLAQPGTRVTMAGTDMTSSATVSATGIAINYTPTAIDVEAGKVVLQVLDAAGKIIKETTISITA